ncbi:MAG TPA: hypothetical protein VKF42_02720 [Chitinivibrionales bacterium]|nr:hypothetical protein [Chitinivibrionales bacterium]
MEGNTKVIDGYTVYVSPLLGETSVLVFYQLQKSLIPAFIKALASMRGVFSQAEDGAPPDPDAPVEPDKPRISFKKLLETDLDTVDFAQIAMAIEEMHATMTAKQWLDFIKQTFSQTTVDAKPVSEKRHFDDIFARHILFMYKVLWFTLRENYGDFFDAVGSLPTIGPEKKPTAPAEK